MLLQKKVRKFLRPIVFTLLRWLSKAQGVMWPDGVMLAEGQKGLDIGCGRRKRPGFVGLDICICPGVDVVCNLEDGFLPFASNTLDMVYASHVFEHIVNLKGLLAEISRVMKPGAKLHVEVPYAGDLRAFQDPAHVRFFTIKTFEYFISEGSRIGGWYLPRHFRKINRRHLVFGRGPLSILMAIVVNRSLILLDFYEASLLRIIPAKNLQVELER